MDRGRVNPPPEATPLGSVERPKTKGLVAHYSCGTVVILTFLFLLSPYSAYSLWIANFNPSLTIDIVYLVV